MKVSTVKVITLTQPWASLIAVGAKQYETRSWQTAFRGPLLIHAAAGLGPINGTTGLYDICTGDPFFETLFGAPDRHFKDPSELPRGRIVASCLLEECFESPGWKPPGCPTDEEAFGDWTEGRYAWELRKVQRTPLIRYRGGQSIRDVDFAKVDDRDYDALTALVRNLEP